MKITLVICLSVAAATARGADFDGAGEASFDAPAQELLAQAQKQASQRVQEPRNSEKTSPSRVDPRYTEGVAPELRSCYRIVEKASFWPLYEAEVEKEFSDLTKAYPYDKSGHFVSREISHRRNDGSYLFLGATETLPRLFDDLAEAIRGTVGVLNIERPREITRAWVIELHQVYRALAEDRREWPHNSFLNDKAKEGLKSLTLSIQAGRAVSLQKTSDAAGATLAVSFSPVDFEEVVRDYTAYHYEGEDGSANPVRQNHLEVTPRENGVSFYQKNYEIAVDPANGNAFMTVGGGLPVQRRQAGGFVLTERIRRVLNDN